MLQRGLHQAFRTCESAKNDRLFVKNYRFLPKTLPKMFAKFPLNLTRNNSWRACFEMSFWSIRWEITFKIMIHHSSTLSQLITSFPSNANNFCWVCFFLCCHLEKKAPWQIVNLLQMATKSQSTQLYPNTSAFHSTDKRQLDCVHWDHGCQVLNCNWKITISVSKSNLCS